MTRRVITLLVLAVLSSKGAQAADGWKIASEKDPLTGKILSFVRGYTGAGEGLRIFDLLLIDDVFMFRLVVPQLAMPVVEHGPNYSTLKAPRELGAGVKWSVDGKSPHTVDPAYSKKFSALANNADYQATWPVSCEEIRELAIGGVLRVVTPNFDAQISLAGFNKYLEKRYQLTQKSLIARSAPICSKPGA